MDFESKNSAFRRLVYSKRIVPPPDMKKSQTEDMIKRLEKLRLETIRRSCSSQEEQEDKSVPVECNC
jgi:hypothetical protein